MSRLIRIYTDWVKAVWVCRNERFSEHAALVYVDWSGYSPFQQIEGLFSNGKTHMGRLMFDAQMMGKSLTAYAHNNMACEQWDPRSEMGASVRSDLCHLLSSNKVLKIIELLCYRIQHDDRTLYHTVDSRYLDLAYLE